MCRPLGTFSRFSGYLVTLSSLSPINGEPLQRGSTFLINQPIYMLIDYFPIIVFAADSAKHPFLSLAVLPFPLLFFMSRVLLLLSLLLPVSCPDALGTFPRVWIITAGGRTVLQCAGFIANPNLLLHSSARARSHLNSPVSRYMQANRKSTAGPRTSAFVSPSPWLSPLLFWPASWTPRHRRFATKACVCLWHQHVNLEHHCLAFYHSPGPRPRPLD